jgi:hypothetical protein
MSSTPSTKAKAKGKNRYACNECESLKDVGRECFQAVAATFLPNLENKTVYIHQHKPAAVA